MNEKILVVDDEESIRFTFQSFLSEQGYAVTVARDYDDAMGILNECRFDLAFVDIVLGGKTGIDLLEQIRGKSPGTSVIIVTGVPSVDSASQSLRMGATDYIVKPLRQNALLRTAKKAIFGKQERVRQEKEQSKVAAIMESMSDGIITVDSSMAVLQVNRAATALCGIDKKRAVGLNFSTVLNGCSGKCLDALNRVIRTSRPVETHHLECRPAQDGNHLVSISASPLKEIGQPGVGGVLVIRKENPQVESAQRVGKAAGADLIVGNSPKIEAIKKFLDRLANVETSVLVTGENGTGKELVVDTLHRIGNRKSGPLVKVNCSALSESLLESELFGYVKGAFTGAVKDGVGRFQKADGGILFLDEIGDVSPRMQLRLLRVIETRAFERVGDSTSVTVNARIIAATNRNLRRKVASGEFREDLYYRLKVVEVPMPALRERPEDIPLLVAHFIEKFNGKFKKKIHCVSANVFDLFMSHNWPGNVRELKNTIEHAFILCNHTTLCLADLPKDFNMRDTASEALSGCHEKIEPQTIIDALKTAGGNKAEAARRLGISRRTIYRKLAKYGRLN